jgi:hypothetical protein
VGAPSEVFARLKDLQEGLERHGLCLNLAKCKLWGPGIQAVGEAQPRYPIGLAMDHPGRTVPVVPFGGSRGITALGVPIDAPKGFPGRDSSEAPECLSAWEVGGSNKPALGAPPGLSRRPGSPRHFAILPGRMQSHPPPPLHRV